MAPVRTHKTLTGYRVLVIVVVVLLLTPRLSFIQTASLPKGIAGLPGHLVSGKAGYNSIGIWLIGCREGSKGIRYVKNSEIVL